MKLLNLIPQWQHTFDTHNWYFVKNDLKCKECNVRASWVTGNEERFYLIEASENIYSWTMTCNELVMKQILE